MQQIEIFDIPSPCKGICLVNNRGYCKGCYRSRDERFSWNSLTNAQKKKVLSLCQQRYKRYLQQKGVEFCRKFIGNQFRGRPLQF